MDFLNDLKGTVREGFKAADDKASELKKSFGRALVDATNLQPADMRSLPAMKQSQNQLREYAAEAADLILPGTTDALPIGKLVKVGKTGMKAISSATKIVNEIKAANLPEMTRKGYELLADKAPKVQSMGKVIVKDAAPAKLGKVIVK